MGGHAERSHSTLSPSNAYQWMACTPSVILGSQFPDTSSKAAEEGTLAHELAELKLRIRKTQDERGDQEIKRK